MELLLKYAFREMNKTPIKLVVADDNNFFVEALSSSLSSYKELNVVAQFTSIDKVINFTKNNDLDILILDVNFNGISSLNYISEIKNGKDFKIISLTTLNNNFIKLEATEKGVDCFVGKDTDLSKFKQEILNCYYNSNNNLNEPSAKIEIDNLVFTKRKLEVLQALYTYSNKNGKALSAILNISESALKSHKRDLFEITNTSNTTELIKFGIQKGLIVA